MMNLNQNPLMVSLSNHPAPLWQRSRNCQPETRRSCAWILSTPVTASTIAFLRLCGNDHEIANLKHAAPALGYFQLQSQLQQSRSCAFVATITKLPT